MILALGILSIVSMSCYTGLVIYAAYHDCDPVTTKVCIVPRLLNNQINLILQFQLVSKSDQVLPFFVTQIATNLPGLPGLFVAGVFSAALR
jgi:solute carrier family 5 (sodium-coupled monocarboxylate transporter), member 8/12